MTKYVPEAGDLVWVDFGETSGHEQSGHRPALVLSHKAFHLRSGLAVVCPITSQVKGYNAEVPLANTRTAGVVLTVHVRTVDINERGVKYIERAPEFVTKRVRGMVAALIGYTV